MSLVFGVDIGNSGLRATKLDLAKGELGETFRIDWLHPTAHGPTQRQTLPGPRYLPSDVAWLAELQRMPLLSGRPTDDDQCPQKWLISSVRRDALGVLTDYLQQRKNASVSVVTYASLPIVVNVEQPEKVGIDRLLAALAAARLAPSLPAVVIQAGSAVTVDLVSAATAAATAVTPSTADDRRHQESSSTEPKATPLATFEGGAILPGVPMMLRLLGQAADLLPEIDADDLIDLPDLPGKNTEQAMLCGASSGLVGGVLHLISRYRSEFGPNLPVIISGGDGMRLSPYLSPPLFVHSHLVQRGLLQLAQLESSNL